jgi:hypothetical protein
VPARILAERLVASFDPSSVLDAIAKEFGMSTYALMQVFLDELVQRVHGNRVSPLHPPSSNSIH